MALVEFVALSKSESCWPTTGISVLVTNVQTNQTPKLVSKQQKLKNYFSYQKPKTAIFKSKTHKTDFKYGLKQKMEMSVLVYRTKPLILALLRPLLVETNNKNKPSLFHMLLNF